jgi:hypothetical protein
LHVLDRPPAPVLSAVEPGFDRERLIDEIIERLRREARLDRERLGLVLEDLL